MKNSIVLLFILMFQVSLVFSQTKPTIEFVEIPAGTFTMGSPTTEVDRYADEVQHQVTVSAFKRSTFEITFEQYDLFCDATRRIKPSDDGFGRGNRPVIHVTWDEASAFAAWIDCRLPTEAEWEYACRAGSTTPFYTGNNISTDQANFDGSYSYNKGEKGIFRKKTSPVGSFEPNAFGLYDMHGNVWEWCFDFYAPYSTEPQTNPKGPAKGIYHPIRGASWFFASRFCRAARRGTNVPDYHGDDLGFRVVAN
jgi:formylglycine-generating enzyme required for sulfatase activity